MWRSPPVADDRGGRSVENVEQAQLLAEIGCDALQGYLLGRPMKAPAVPGWLLQNKAVLPA